MITVADLADELNDLAPSLVPDLLPNGYRSGNVWMCSGVADHGGSASMWVNLSGAKIGKWQDAGNCGPDEQHGDVLDLIRLVKCGGDMKAAVDEAKRILGKDDPWTPGAPAQMSPEEKARRAEEAKARASQRERQLEKERAAKMRGARALYLHSDAVDIARTPADYYLRGRMLRPGPSQDDAWPGVLRFHPEVYCKDVSVKVPAMLAAVYTADGTHVATHRTFLANDAEKGWRKLDVPRPKKVLGPLGGGFIPINKGSSGKPMSKMADGEPVYVTEGIEDAIAVRMKKPEARIIAAINLGNIGAIVLPEAARRLIIVADRDDGNADAQDALERGIARQQARGMEVSLVVPPAEWNGRPIKDINDWIIAEASAPRGEMERS